MKKCNVQWKSAMCNEICAICNGKVQWAMKFVQSTMKQCNVQWRSVIFCEVKILCYILWSEDSAFQRMLLPSEGRGIDFLKNLTAFQDLVSKTQVMKCRLFSGIFSAILSVLLIHSFPSRDNFHKIQNDSKKIMQTDANLVDCVGGSRPVHRSLLRVKFPVLRDLKDFDAVILDGVTPEEVDLLVELTYGMNRLHSIHVFWWWLQELPQSSYCNASSRHKKG